MDVGHREDCERLVGACGGALLAAGFVPLIPLSMAFAVNPLETIKFVGGLLLASAFMTGMGYAVILIGQWGSE